MDRGVVCARCGYWAWPRRYKGHGLEVRDDPKRWVEVTAGGPGLENKG